MWDGKGAQGPVAEDVSIEIRSYPSGLGVGWDDERERGWVVEKENMRFVGALSEMLGIWGKV